jgi:protein O-GlcNAc transferase
MMTWLRLSKKTEIDVLVELSGHTGDNRLVMLAERVAPVQVTYLGYPNTTGLANMDYRITDQSRIPRAYPMNGILRSC